VRRSRGARRALPAITVVAVIAVAAALLFSVEPRTEPGRPRRPRTIGGCTGVGLRPHDGVGDIVADEPPGTTFCFGRGVYHLKDALEPDDGDSFVGLPGAILDGSNKVGSAIEGTASDVTVTGLIVQHFDSRAQVGAIQAKGASGWTIEHNEVRSNGAVGITLGSRSVARDNFTHDNGQLGIKAPDSVDSVVEDNEIAFNNPDLDYDQGSNAGGAKFTNSTGLVVRRNHVHDNRGNGIWLDIDNRHALVENNLVENNEGQGIFYEISYDAVIRGNEVRGNVRLRDGEESCTLLYGAGILVAHSPNVEVYDNDVEDNCNGIGGIQQTRGSGDFGKRLLENLYVHDNRIVMTEGQSGVAQPFNSSPDAFDPERNNRFEDNVYIVPDDSRQWWTWDGDELTWQQWQASGNDTGGKVGEGDR
jgi:parallel beta-helix repeat protein